MIKDKESIDTVHEEFLRTSLFTSIKGSGSTFYKMMKIRPRTYIGIAMKVENMIPAWVSNETKELARQRRILRPLCIKRRTAITAFTEKALFEPICCQGFSTDHDKEHLINFKVLKSNVQKNNSDMCSYRKRSPRDVLFVYPGVRRIVSHDHAGSLEEAFFKKWICFHSESALPGHVVYTRRAGIFFVESFRFGWKCLRHDHGYPFWFLRCEGELDGFH